jgi:hypothetical protein
MTSLLQNRRVQDLLIYGVILLTLALIFFGLFAGIETAADNKTAGEPVHWHAAISYEACGKDLAVDDRYKSSGEEPLLHGHNDGDVHVEGVIIDIKQVNLQQFFQNADLNISADHLLTYKNGDTCPLNITPGAVHFIVDGTEVADPSQIIIADDQTIKVSFY